MRWWVFAIVAYVLLAAQIAVAPAISVETPAGLIEPRFVLLLAVFVGLYAPARAAITACLILGLLLDLASTWPTSATRDLTLIGPYTLGYFAGGYVLLQTRTMLVRHHPLSIAFMMLLAGVAVQLVVVAVFEARGWYQPLEGWSALGQLVVRGAGLVYSAAIGAVLAIPLNAMAPLFAFAGGKGAGRRGRKR